MHRFARSSVNREGLVKRAEFDCNSREDFSIMCQGEFSLQAECCLNFLVADCFAFFRSLTYKSERLTKMI